ncbi:Tad domain-containing protein [Bacillus tuaregi]|uniref:Tad domain-containing protein n=1 Tax=Bacillus tuaregi TaxID=1816695 RepID=UPI0008F968A8|nr:Tad domain-containing protein [Bacillus tuaregi]
MKHLKNENGNAAIFMLWLLGIVAVIFILTVNIVKVYVVKEQANLAVEQAALAGTAVLLDKTKEAVNRFDTRPTIDPLYLADREVQRITDSGKSIEELIQQEMGKFLARGLDEGDSYIMAVNKVLPERIEGHPFLKKELKQSLGLSSSDTVYLFSPAVMSVITDNQARAERTELSLSREHWRIEVKSAVLFESISDESFMSSLLSDIPQIGYGPTLEYLEKIYN